MFLDDYSAYGFLSDIPKHVHLENIRNSSRNKAKVPLKDEPEGL